MNVKLHKADPYYVLGVDREMDFKKVKAVYFK
jgi:hypothetical protein